MMHAKNMYSLECLYKKKLNTFVMLINYLNHKKKKESRLHSIKTIFITIKSLSFCYV